MIKVDWDRVILKAIPAFLRRTRRVDWLTVLTGHTRSLNRDFDQLAGDIKRRMTHNGQVIYLEKVLNDIFDPIDRQIEIRDGDWANKIYLYQKAEDLPHYLYYRYFSGVAYLQTDQIQESEKAYEANQNYPTEDPSLTSTQWNLIGSAELVRSEEDYKRGARFYVVYPISLLINQNELNAVVRYYRSAPASWKIIQV